MDLPMMMSRQVLKRQYPWAKIEEKEIYLINKNQFTDGGITSCASARVLLLEFLFVGSISKR
jgi:hypothetical protein